MMAASLGTFGRIWSATARHCTLAASGVSWAKAVAMKADTTRRPLLPAWASTLRMKWTRQRCQVAQSTLVTAALMPSWASETTSLTPRSPRRVSLRRNSVQIGSASEVPTSHAQHLAPSVAVDADGDDDGDRHDAPPATDLQVGGVDPQIRPVAFDRPLQKAFTLPSISSHNRLTWLLEMPVIPIACTRSSTERVDTPLM